MRTDAITLSSSLLNTLYGNKTTEASTSLVDLLGTDSSASAASTDETADYYSGSTDFSTTTSFFSELRSVAASDPDTYQELVTTLGERLRSARGYAGQMLASLSEQVASGTDIAEVILQSGKTQSAE